MLAVIAREPDVARWGNWTRASQVGLQVSEYLARAAAESPGTVPELSTYWIVDAKQTHPDCGRYSDTPARERLYNRWIRNFARGIGDSRAIVFFEVDSLITVGCLSHHGVQVRLQELHDAFDALSADPRVVVYTDAGAADALNAHRGPIIPRDRRRNGNEDLCSPPGRGLGPLPTFSTGFRDVDAFAWIVTPGRSSGCGKGAPPTGRFWVKRALSLVRHADFQVR